MKEKFKKSLKKVEETSFTERQLEFVRDSQSQIIKKYENNCYSNFKQEIFKVIQNKLKNAYCQRYNLRKRVYHKSLYYNLKNESLTKKIRIYDSFISKVEKDKLQMNYRVILVT